MKTTDFYSGKCRTAENFPYFLIYVCLLKYTSHVPNVETLTTTSSLQCLEEDLLQLRRNVNLTELLLMRSYFSEVIVKRYFYSISPQKNNNVPF